MNRLIPLIAVALLAAPSAARAQCPAAAPSTTPLGVRAPANPGAAVAPGPRIARAPECPGGSAARSTDLAARFTPRTPRAAGTGRSLITAVGGAVIGAWVGYFASQVAVSDWDAAGGGELNRGTWAIGGAVAGGLGGLILGRAGPADPMGPATTPAPRGRTMILRDEIIGSGASNALDLVRSLRAEWLVVRGANSFRETARGTDRNGSVVITDPGQETLLAYLDDARLGGPDALAQVPIESIQYIQFLDASAATYRWGAGHTHGAILVSTRALP